jgi:hypothetical protein
MDKHRSTSRLVCTAVDYQAGTINSVFQTD